MRKRLHRGLSAFGCLLLMGFAVASCGGGGGSAAEATLSGSVYAGPVGGATILVRQVGGISMAGPVTTAADGSFTVQVPGASLGGDLILEASGGTFTDEATGAAVSTGRMAAFSRGGSLTDGSAVNITIGSTVVADLIEQHGISRYEAERSFGTTFGYIPDIWIQPANDATADEEGRLAALRAGAFSQLAHDLGLTPSGQFDLANALVEDLSDGTLDGEDADGLVPLAVAGFVPEDIQNRFEHALLGYLENTNNLTELDVDEIGLFPFAKVALTDSYRVEYLPLDPGASLGRTPFALLVADRSTGDPVPGLDIVLQPVMHMVSQGHSTPVDAITDNGDGTYDAAVYYLMAGGEGWGYWRLNITLDDSQTTESLDFFPSVGSPNLAYLRGQEDLVEGIGGGQNRVYYLIDDGLTVQNLAAGTYRFGLFVAAGEDEWHYPALATGLQLHDENGTPWTVTSVAAEFSRDAANWKLMTDDGGGHWSVSDITGLDPYASEMTLYVRLNVNGEQKTTDGGTATDFNGYAALKSGGASCCF